MIYLNNNKFLLNNFDTYKEYKDEISDKETVIKLLYEKLDISSDYSIYFINNIYEAYKLVIHSIITSYSNIKKKPHIIVNKMEDPKILDILEEFSKNNVISISFIKSNIYGSINVSEIEKVIQKNKTCLIINSFINYFTGAINNVSKIGELAHRYKIPLFCDCTYTFGKLPIKPKKNNIDILTFDMNYPGLSFIVINNDLLQGYKLAKYSIKFDNTVEEFNIEDPSIYGLAKSILSNIYKNRQSKNKKLIALKNQIIKHLNKMYYCDFIKQVPAKDIDVIIFGNDIKNENASAPHIISILKIKGRKVSNAVTCCDVPKEAFSFIGINDKWQKKVITIGLSDYTTKNDVIKLLKSF
jgi:cysteine sulfinate desulfinase/cysteine desulfurase-like protein